MGTGIESRKYILAQPLAAVLGQPMIKAVLFDFGQTLVDSADGFRTAEKRAQTLLRDNLALNLTDDFSAEIFLAEYRRLRKQFQTNSNYSRKSLWEAVYERFAQRADPRVLEQWEEDYWQRVKGMTRVFPETVEVLHELGRKYQIALITNTQGQPRRAEHRLSEFPELERFFETIVVAGESDVAAKPAPRPFEICLAKLEIQATQAVYVGDDWRNDVCGAQDAGLRAVWIKHNSVKRNWPKVEIEVPIITSLKSLLDLNQFL